MLEYPGFCSFTVSHDTQARFQRGEDTNAQASLISVFVSLYERSIYIKFENNIKIIYHVNSNEYNIYFIAIIV